MLVRHRHPVVGRFPAVRRAAFLLLFGFAHAPPFAAIAQQQALPDKHSFQADPYAGHIAEAARRFGLPEAWIHAVMRVESQGDVRAISSAGAMGLMQIMPATWSELRVRHALGRDPYDPRDNILAGAAYLREMRDRYGSPGFLAAYNAGPGRYEEYLAGRPLPAETRAYVAVLAPIIGGGDLTAPVAAADPLAWARAPLFVVRSSNSDSVAPMHREGAETPQAADDQNAIGSQSDGLFVARDAAGGPR